MERSQETESPSEGLETATLGGGCFWCLEAVFDELRGVRKVVSGYSGGSAPNPSYQQVCSGRTGHAEVVQVVFDPAEISYRELLRFFFAFHDPTTLNRQGADTGTQYRSVIFCHDSRQKEISEELIRELESEHIWPDPIVTQVEPLEVFYPAEDYHQSFYRLNGRQPYCQFVISPKMKKLRELYRDRLKVR